MASMDIPLHAVALKGADRKNGRPVGDFRKQSYWRNYSDRPIGVPVFSGMMCLLRYVVISIKLAAELCIPLSTS